MPVKKQKTVKFNQILDALKDLSRPFPPSYLHHFSDLSNESTQLLRQGWGSVQVERRRALLSDLEELSDADTLVSFLEVGRLALEDEDAQVRSLGIRLLWEAEDISLIPILIGMMENDPDANVRATAANGLGAYIYLGEIESLSQSLLETIEESLLKVTASKDQSIVRQRALESLGFSSRREVPDLIEQAYQSGTPEWIESALFAMGRSADARWGSIVLKELDNANPEIQHEAIRAAGELQLASARQRLLDMLEETEDDVTLTALAWSLSQIGGDGVRAALENLVDEVEDDELGDIFEEALDNLSFTEDMAIFDLFDLDVGGDPDSFVDLDQLDDSEDGDGDSTRPGKEH